MPCPGGTPPEGCPNRVPVRGGRTRHPKTPPGAPGAEAQGTSAREDPIAPTGFPRGRSAAGAPRTREGHSQCAAACGPPGEVTSHRSRPGGGYRLRRAPECLRGRVANGQRSTDSIGAPRRRATRGPPAPAPPMRPRDRSPESSRRRRRRPPPGPEQVRTSPGGARPTVAERPPSDPPERTPSLGPRKVVQRLGDYHGDPAHGSLEAGDARPAPPGGKSPRGKRAPRCRVRGNPQGRKGPRRLPETDRAPVDLPRGVAARGTDPLEPATKSLPHRSPKSRARGIHGGFPLGHRAPAPPRTAHRRVVHGGAHAAAAEPGSSVTSLISRPGDPPGSEAHAARPWKVAAE